MQILFFLRLRFQWFQQSSSANLFFFLTHWRKKERKKKKKSEKVICREGAGFHYLEWRMQSIHNYSTQRLFCNIKNHVHFFLADREYQFSDELCVTNSFQIAAVSQRQRTTMNLCVCITIISGEWVIQINEKREQQKNAHNIVDNQLNDRAEWSAVCVAADFNITFFIDILFFFVFNIRIPFSCCFAAGELFLLFVGRLVVQPCRFAAYGNYRSKVRKW